MREIKFRAWDEEAQKMSYSTIEHFDDMLGFRFNHFETDEPIFMQYTGLKDKNGREIYEGDIVKHVMKVRVGTRRTKVGRRYESYGIYEDKEIIGVIEKGYYNVGIGTEKISCWVVKSSMKTNYDSYFFGEGKRTDRPTNIEQELSEPLFSDKEYEVIGNIYENPELLGDPQWK